MKKEDLEEFYQKQIKITLKTGFFYTCKITLLNEGSVHVLDKFGKRHIFDLGNIETVSEGGERQ